MTGTAGILSSVIAGCLLSAAINIVRTLWMLSPRNRHVICIGPWSARLTDGGTNMTLHQKAVVAVTGLWAMTSREAVYFTALHDSDGNRLRSGASYIITGNSLPAVWWSITVYCNYQFIPNEQYRYSRSITTTDTRDDGSWTIHLSPEPVDTNWIPAGHHTRGLIAISLRLYMPHSLLFDNQSELALPTIHRITLPGNATGDTNTLPADSSSMDSGAGNHV